MKGPLIALAFAIVVIVAAMLFEPLSPIRCDAASPHGPRIADSMRIEGCP